MLLIVLVIALSLCRSSKSEEISIEEMIFMDEIDDWDE